ncbi:MAG: DUF2330 domain-containing protein [Planctomycetota bacterium]|jgi:hypothetical protein
MRCKAIGHIILSVFITLLFYGLCDADGFFMPEVKKKIPDIPTQRAVLQYRDGMEKLIIESTLDVEGDSYGWIMPLPNIPRRIEKFSPGLLKTLSLQIQPQIHQAESDRYLFGLSWTTIFTVLVAGVCFSIILWGLKGAIVSIILAIFVIFAVPQHMELAARAGPSSTIKPLVEIKNKARVGNYDVTILEAKDSTELDKWLKKNNFQKLPDNAARVIDDYIASKWYFAVAKLITTDNGLSTPHPILFEFMTDKPVYPLKLTAISGSKVYLELFVVADQGAVPIGYKIKKEYCDYFKYKEFSDYDDSFHRTGTRVIKAFTPIVFWGRDKEIAHTDAAKVMWDGCVVTKFADKVSSKEMNDDLFLEFEEAQPFQLELYTPKAKLDKAHKAAAKAFMIALICVAICYRIIIKRRKLLLLSLLLTIVSVLCVTVFIQTYKSIPVVTDVITLRSYWHKEVLNHLYAFFSLAQNEKLTDSELMEKLAESRLSNEITREPMILEDSPGNIRILRKYGRFAGVNLYNTNGAPYSLKSNNYIQILETKDLISALKDEDPEVRIKSAIELGERNDPGTVVILKSALQDDNPSVRNSAQLAIAKITKHQRHIPNIAYALNITMLIDV